jgi:hypothetical protein
MGVATLFLAIITVALGHLPSARADEPPLHEQATTSAVARQEALAAIPLNQLAAPYRALVREVIDNPTLYRRMPTGIVDCYPEFFTYFAQNPEALVAIWQQLGVSRVQLERIEPQKFRLLDGNGTTGELVIVHEQCQPRAQNHIVMFADGRYEGKPFARPVTARCVILLRSGSFTETNDRDYVAARLDSFIKFDRPGLELAAKVVHPWVGNTADRNFTDTIRFLGNLSLTAEHRPESIEKLAGDLKQLDQPRRDSLVQVTHECADAGQRWREQRRAAAQRSQSSTTFRR